MNTRVKWTAENCRTYNRGMRLLYDGMDALAKLKETEMETAQLLILADAWDFLFVSMENLGEAGAPFLGWRTKQLIARQYK